MAVERLRPLGLGRRQHRVEERHAIAVVAHARGGVQRAERRVRLPRLPQLRVEAQEVRLAEQDVDRRSPGRTACAASDGAPALGFRPVADAGAAARRRPSDAGDAARFDPASARERASAVSR